MIAEEQDDTPPPRRQWPVVLLLLVAAFLLGVLAMLWALNDHRIRALVVEEQTTAAAASALPAPAPPVPTIAPPTNPVGERAADVLDQRVASLETRIDQVSRRAQSAAGDAARAEGMLVAFAARRALDRGLGLGYLEGQLNDRFGPAQPQAVATIIAASREPATLEDLQLGLEEIGPTLVRGGADEGWWDGARRQLSQLISIRRAGTPSTQSTERLRRARRMLEGGRVDAAMAEVARTPGRDAAADWLASARRYVTARQALDVIETSALLSGGPRPAPETPTGQEEPIAPADAL